MQIGKVLRNHYRIVKLLGSGGFGDTYLAEDLDLPQHPKCVVKHLKPKNPNPEVLPVAKRLFESEAEVLYRLGNLHPQIPKLFAHFEENGEFYLVQEFVDGYDLSAEINPSKQWSEADVIQLLQDILEVLAVVHQENIIHRDIKPRNLMRRRQDGKIILIDFGAVKEIKGLAADTQGLVNSTIVIGTSGYMPNEQANRKPRLCSDVYAVGMIGIQALTGKIPNELPEDSSNGEIIWRHLANVSDRLADVLTNMVRSHFSQRYQTAAQALQALTPTVISLATLPPAPTPKSNLFRRRFIQTVGFISAGFGLVILVGQLLQSAPKDITKNPTPSPTPTATQAIKLPLLPCGDEPSAVPSPTGTPNKIFHDGKYYGPLEKGKLNGKGIIVYANGARYDGNFQNNQRNGCGTLLYGDGIRYVGEFRNDEFDGLGKLLWKNGNKYIGQFKSGKCHGSGTLIEQNDKYHQGNWEDDKFVADKQLLCRL